MTDQTQSKTFNEFWNKPETIALRKKMTNKRYKISTTWPVQLHANGELQINADLTSEQIKEVIKLIKKLGV